MFTQAELLAETVKLQKFSMKLTKNKSHADDLFQSTCLRALEKAHYFQDGTNLFSWTSKIMYNLFVSDYRRKVKFETQFDPEPVILKQTVAASQEINSELAKVKRAMMQLNPDYREVLILVCVQGMRYEEASEMLQIPVGTVRSRLSRARAQLQAILDKPPAPVVAPQYVVSAKPPANTNIPRVPAYLVARARSVAKAAAISMR